MAGAVVDGVVTLALSQVVVVILEAVELLEVWISFAQQGLCPCFFIYIKTPTLVGV